MLLVRTEVRVRVRFTVSIRIRVRIRTRVGVRVGGLSTICRSKSLIVSAIFPTPAARAKARNRVKAEACQQRWASMSRCGLACMYVTLTDHAE